MSFNVSLGFARFAGGGPISGVVVHRYQLRDALSELFELSIELASTDPTLDFHTVAGEKIVVGFPDDPLQPPIEGIVKGVRQLSSNPPSATGQSASGYAIDVVPALWLTTRRRDHRFFEKKGATDIVAEILAGYGGRIAPPVVRVAKAAPVREYVVQYGETDWEFIGRILAEDFITSFFDHASHGAFTLVDDTTRMTTAPAAPTPFIPPSNLTTPPPHVFNVVLSSNIETSATAVARLRLRAPAARARGQEEGGPGRRAVPGRARSRGLFLRRRRVHRSGRRRRARRAPARVAPRAGAHVHAGGELHRPARAPDIDLSGHPRSDVNAAFLVVRTRVILDDGGERGLSAPAAPSATFLLECIPATVPFLPAPRPKPRIHGTQTGTVVGGADGDVVADSMSRVHVLFKWDRQKLASKKTRPVRVSQAWAGTGYGFFVMPRVGDEVVLAYLDGDPDDPMVVGRVHNAARVNPVDPESQEGIQKTISKWRSQTLGDPAGFNEVLMDDLQNKERLELHAQRDFRSTVEHDATTLVRHDDALTVGHNKTDKIDKALTVQAGSVSVSCGPYSLSASKIKATAKTTIFVEAGDSLTEKAPKIEIEGDSSVHVQGGDVLVEGGKITLKAGRQLDRDRRRRDHDQGPQGHHRRRRRPSTSTAASSR